MRIFVSDFSDNKEKGRRHTVLCLVILTQLAGKFAKKTCVAKILNRLLENCSFITVKKILLHAFAVYL